MSQRVFSEKELIRYSRHLVLPHFGVASQQKLAASKVAIVGAGGLGCPVLLYLAAAGVGQLTVIDEDQINLSNLQRQVIFTADEVNLSKAAVASDKIKKLNPEISIRAIQKRLNTSNAIELLKEHDLIIDCTDNFPTRYLINDACVLLNIPFIYGFPTRYLINDACVLLNIPFIYGSVFRYEGQVSVFNYKDGPNYRDLYPLPPAPESVPNCEQGGVLGVLTGIIGSLQANEALKIVGDFGEPLSGKLLIYDSWNSTQTLIKILNRNSKEKIKNLINYDEFCGLSNVIDAMKEVTVQELKAMMDSGADFQLIDVREPHEYDICNLGGELIPQGEIPHQVERVSKDKKVILQCRSGARSGNMVQWLEKNHGFTNLYNLKGGILAWAREIDTTMPTY
ncbi:MAG: ThiF family adenylyltransferase [Cyclobacteriaceae bacterium]|nr:ThiF family adenylyltransferase [Cyclobacteriaceae bacterium]